MSEGRAPARWGAVRVVVLAALLAGWAQVQSALPNVDAAALAALPDGSNSVQLAALQAETARLDAVAAGAVVSATLRTDVNATWQAEAAGATPAGWNASLGAITLSTQWNVVPAGPTYDAAQRAERAYGLALAALAEARRDAVLEALDQVVALERLRAQGALAEARLDLARRTRDTVAEQVAAGAATPHALAEAELTVAQAEGDQSAVQADEAAARLAFERTFGVPVEAVWAPDEDPLANVAVDVPVPLSPSAAEIDAAVAASDRVAEATRALDDAEVALARARRDAGVTASLTARATVAGDGGRYALGAAWDTRSLQPSADLSIDAWNAASPQTSLALGASFSVPLGAANSAGVAQAEVAVEVARTRLEQARWTATTELEALLRAVDQAERALGIAIDRLAIRTTTLTSVRVRADLGAASPLDLRRAELDVLDASLAVVRAQDDARDARTRTELALGLVPTDAWLAAALSAALAAEPMEVP